MTRINAREKEVMSEPDPEQVGQPDPPEQMSTEEWTKLRQGKAPHAHVPARPDDSADPLFDEFWDAYPRKVGKGAARRAWRKALRSGADLEQVIVAAGCFRTQCFAQRTEARFIPHPANWLSSERYGDETAAQGETATLPIEPPRSPGCLNDEQLLAMVIRLTSDQDHPVTTASAIIHAVRQQATLNGVVSFPEVDEERGRHLAELPYPDYLLTPEWQERRRIILKRAGYRCQVCNRDRQLHVHHRTYERRGVELPGDLTALCDECHALFHGKGLIPDEPAA